MPLILVRSFSAFSDLASPGNLWKKVRTFSAHDAPAISKVEENPVLVTSIHWLRRYNGINGPLLVSFLYHGVK